MTTTRERAELPASPPQWSCLLNKGRVAVTVCPANGELRVDKAAGDPVSESFCRTDLDSQALALLALLVRNKGSLPSAVFAQKFGWGMLQQTLKSAPWLRFLVFLGNNRVSLDERGLTALMAPEVITEDLVDRPDSFSEEEPRTLITLRQFAINFSDKPPKFDKAQGEVFSGCHSYLREALRLLGEEDALNLIKFLSLYAGINWQKESPIPRSLRLKKEDFAEISITILREVVGRHRNFRQVADSADFKDQYFGNGPECYTRNTIWHYVRDTFYYWVAVMHQIMPQLNLPAEEKLRKKATFKIGASKAGLALERATTILSLAHAISEERTGLVQLGVSLTQQELWLGALVGISPRNYQTIVQDEREELSFRHYATSGPVNCLVGERARVIIGRLPKTSCQRRIGVIIKKLVDCFETAEATKTVGSMREPRMAVLRWLRQRTEEEMVDIIDELASHPYKGEFNRIFSGKEYRPSKQCARRYQREYSGRADSGKMAASTLEMVIEFLEGKKPPGILYPQKPAKEVALRLLKKAEENLAVHPELFNRSVCRQLSSAKTKLMSLDDGRLAMREILNLLYVASKKPFSAKGFLSDFREVFNFDLLWLEEPEVK